LKKKFNKAYTNSMVELATIVRASTIATGGSALSDYGTISNANNYSLITLNRIILTYLYTGNGIFRRAIQVPVLDAISKGIEIESDEASQDDIDEILDWFICINKDDFNNENNNLWNVILNYFTWTRLYGGGGILINTDQDPTTKFNIKSINQYTPLAFYDVDRWMFSSPQSVVTNVEDFYLQYGNSDKYYIYGQELHKSRVIISTGRKAPSYVRRQLKSWGLSEAEAMIRDLNNYIKTSDVLYEILDESKIDVYYIQNLASKLVTSGGTKAIQSRIQAANELKNYLNALLLDANDKWEQKQIQFGGLAEVQRENRIGIAACLNMPVTKIFGMSAAGFNSGEDDIENYNAMVDSEIRPKIQPVIKSLLNIGFQKLFGYIPKYKIKFPSLRILSSVDEENVKTAKTNRILSLFQGGLLNGKQAMQMLKKESIITIEVDENTVPDKPIPPNGEEAVDKVDTTPQSNLVSVKRQKPVMQTPEPKKITAAPLKPKKVTIPGIGIKKE
jgi:phage-related protein (TIGR01555 family)